MLRPLLLPLLFLALFAENSFGAAYGALAPLPVAPDSNNGCNGPVSIGTLSGRDGYPFSAQLSPFANTPRGPGNVWLTVNGDVSVKGAVRANEVRVSVPNGSYPDYVFASGYKLMLLPDVELSIQKDGHLPGVPSAKDIESSGLAVSTMMVKQMEKIEELTLYAIQLDKTNKDLQKRLAALEARLATGKE